MNPKIWNQNNQLEEINKEKIDSKYNESHNYQFWKKNVKTLTVIEFPSFSKFPKNLLEYRLKNNNTHPTHTFWLDIKKP